METNALQLVPAGFTEDYYSSLMNADKNIQSSVYWSDQILMGMFFPYFSQLSSSLESQLKRVRKQESQNFLIFDYPAFKGDEYFYRGMITEHMVCQSFGQYQDLLFWGTEGVKYWPQQIAH